VLSYQHLYHAGNPADVHKHIVLAEVLRLLTKKERGISYLETHAGRGLYDLAAAEAVKTGEAEEGIGRISLGDGSALGNVLAKIRLRYGESHYPGSPVIAANLLRPQDRIVLMEKHPREVLALRRSMKGTGAGIHHRDGYEGVYALTPPEPRRGLVLIDPSYEVKDEYAGVAAFALRLLERWPEAAVMVWYPLLAAERHHDMIAALEAQVETLRQEVLFDLKGGKGMRGSGILLLNPPYRSDAALSAVHDQAGAILRPA
jgi:23S rRNA (adenine2030-N6)-methyltransferase